MVMVYSLLLQTLNCLVEMGLRFEWAFFVRLATSNYTHKFHAYVSVCVHVCVCEGWVLGIKAFYVAVLWKKNM